MQPIERVKFLQLMCDGLTVKEATQALGIGIQTGTDIAQALRNKLAYDLENAGLGNEFIINKLLKPALEANNVKYFSHGGVVMDEREGPDWQARLNALHVLLKLKGSYQSPRDNRDGEDDAGEINVNIQVVGVGDQAVRVDTKET